MTKGDWGEGGSGLFSKALMTSFLDGPQSLFRVTLSDYVNNDKFAVSVLQSLFILMKSGGKTNQPCNPSHVNHFSSSQLLLTREILCGTWCLMPYGTTLHEFNLSKLYFAVVVLEKYEA